MEVRKGYQQTEVGYIPNDWSLFPLDKLIDEKRPIRYGIVQPGKYDLQGRFMVRGQDYSFGWADSSTLFKVSAEVEERYKNARLKTGDLLLTIVGAGTGHFEIVPSWLEGANITQTTARISIDESKIDSRFCKYFFQSKAGRNLISLYIKGAAQPGLNIGDVRTFVVPLPSKSEQTAIATALSDTDTLITSLEKLIAKKRNIKQGAMQELFSSNDEKELVSVSALTHFHKQGYYTQETYKPNGKLYLLRGTDMQNPKIDLSSTPKIDANEKDFHAYKVEIGDFLFVRSGAIGRYGIVKNQIDAVFGSYLINFRFDGDRLLNDYFGYFYESEFALKQLMSITQGSSNININAENIKSLRVPLPSLTEQIRIASILSDIDLEINALESKLEKYKEIKSGMIQNLLTGKIRLV